MSINTFAAIPSVITPSVPDLVTISTTAVGDICDTGNNINPYETVTDIDNDSQLLFYMDRFGKF